MSIDMEQDAGAASSDALQRITKMAGLLAKAEKRVADAQAELTAANEEFTRLEREDLPTLMRELGLTSLKLEDGQTVEVVDDLNCGISEERREDAHDWLVKQGFGGLIKTSVSIGFERGDVAKARKLALQLQKKYPGEVLCKESVHSSTLKSFCKEQLAIESTVPLPKKFVPLPRDKFGIHTFVKAKVTAPKGRAIKAPKKK